MLVKCPACNASASLEAWLAVDQGRSALVQALKMPALGGLLVQYLGMFRAAGRVLAFARVENLLGELQPMLDKQIVVRNGLTRRCPHEFWQQALERMVEQRDSGKLDLPLKSHGYLLEIVFSLAERAGAQEEKATEVARRSGATRDQADERMERMLLISRTRGDLQLGLLDREQAERHLRDNGIDPVALNG